jgi:signal peptidase I
MTPIDDRPADNNPPRSPWLSIWFRPGDTIERVVSTKPAATVLLLAGLGTASSLIGVAIDSGLTTALKDWRNLATVILIGLVGGVPLLYINALFFGLGGRLLGGHASQAHIRAALAWSMVPSITGFAICLAVLIGLTLSAAVDSSRPLSDAVSLGLSAITLVSALWAVVVTILTLRRVQRFGAWRAIVNVGIGWILGGIAAALPIRTLLFQPFSIPAGSMAPTILSGDRIFVSKYAYGYTHYSLPFSPPLFSGRMFALEPKRGDVVVFRLPKDDTTDYVKRIVGLPGDRIQMIQGVLNINGAPIRRERAEDFRDEEGRSVKRWHETLPNGVSYYTLDLQENGFLDNTQVYVIPPGHYFVLGDNLDNSTDSRVLNQVGYVPFENLVGRAEVIFFSIDRVGGNTKPAIRSERFGMIIR